jgi:cytochrome P450
MSTVTLNIVLSALFSEDRHMLTEGPGENIFDLLTMETERNLLFAQRFRALGKRMMEIISKRRKEGRVCHDFVGMMMEARNKRTGQPMKDKQLLDEIRTLIIAGHETTALTLTWTWYLISQNSQIYQKLYDEINKVLPNKGPEFSDLEKLPYMDAVINETLRLYPPAWLIPRRNKAADHLGPYIIPAGSDIFISPYFLQRDPAVWDAPDTFNPDRFLLLNSNDRHKLSYIPFSAGPRRCIGDYFSLIEMKFHLALLVKEFKLTHIDDRPIELESQVNLRSKYPIFMKIHTR